MLPEQPFRKLTVLLSGLLILAGVALVIWLLGNLPNRPPSVASAANDLTVISPTTVPALASTSTPSPTVESEARVLIPLPPAAEPLAVALADGWPSELQALLGGGESAQPGLVLVSTDAPTATLRLDWDAEGGDPLYQQTFALATKFNTIEPTMAYTELQQIWAGETANFGAIAVLSDTLPALTQIFGPRGLTVTGYTTAEEVTAAAWSKDPLTLALLPFEQLLPKLVVFAIDGQNPVENANRFDPEQYPLVATLYLHRLGKVMPEQQPIEAAFLAAIPPGNRDPDRLTVIAMTGVTAMCRLTAKMMDENGPAWPAEVVGPELAAADITHISNEVPFVEDCETDTNPENLNFCSKPEYLATLTASGADIIGLTGNHQNDYGRENALKSLAFYEENGLPVYGGGKDMDAAFAPYYVQHNGNRLAFMGANSYGPEFAFATTDSPGSAPFHLEIMSGIIDKIRTEDRADVVLVELQYQETYDVSPLVDQRVNFNALLKAGADIVTGVQSHVPQALEFTDGKLILYGLGNLYFDQMWGGPTREGMIVKHTIYKGRHLSTQILTTFLYDYGQPRWATPEQRASMLQRVFAMSYWE